MEQSSRAYTTVTSGHSRHLVGATFENSAAVSSRAQGPTSLFPAIEHRACEVTWHVLLPARDGVSDIKQKSMWRISWVGWAWSFYDMERTLRSPA